MSARLAHIAREGLLTVGAGLGVLCLVLTTLGFALDVRPLVFRSGSMSPTIETGDLGIARSVDAGALRPGDIVSVVTSDGDRVTHRVVGSDRQHGAWQLTLKGDANQVPDRETYTVSRADRLLFAVPEAGYALGWLASPVGLFALGGYAVFLASVVLRPRGRSHATVVLMLIIGFGVGFNAAGRAVPTRAAFTDNVPISGASLTAYTVPPTPSFTCGAVGNRRVTFNWTAVADATSYVFRYGNSGTQTKEVTATTVTLTSSGSNTAGIAWVEVKRTFGGVAWTSVASTTRNYTLAQPSTCS